MMIGSMGRASSKVKTVMLETLLLPLQMMMMTIMMIMSILKWSVVRCQLLLNCDNRSLQKSESLCLAKFTL